MAMMGSTWGEKEKKLTQKEKLKIAHDVAAELNKKFGKTVLSVGFNKTLERLPFSCQEMNDLVSGGLPKGRFVVIWGPKGCGKTTAAYDVTAQTQKAGGVVLWIDMERSFHKEWAEALGVDTKKLIFSGSIDSAEEAMDLIIAMSKTKSIDLIVVDSIQGLSPKAEQETKKGIVRSVNDDTMAALARKLSQFFRMSASGVAQGDCCVLMIGQTRKDLGGFVALDKLSGGSALEHWSSLTLQFRRGRTDEAPAVSAKTGRKVKNSKDSITVGFRVVMRVDKSKVGADEGKEIRLDFLYNKGFNKDEGGGDTQDEEIS